MRPVQAALGAKQDLQAQISERDGYVQQWRNDAGQQLAEQERKLADMRRDRQQGQAAAELVVLRADRDAIVLSIAPVSVGSVLQPVGSVLHAGADRLAAGNRVGC